MAGIWVCIGILAALSFMQIVALSTLLRRTDLLCVASLDQHDRLKQLRDKVNNEKQERQTSGN